MLCTRGSEQFFFLRKIQLAAPTLSRLETMTKNARNAAFGHRMRTTAARKAETMDIAKRPPAALMHGMRLLLPALAPASEDGTTKRKKIVAVVSRIFTKLRVIPAIQEMISLLRGDDSRAQDCL